MSQFVRLTEISIVRSNSGLIDYWTESPAMVDVSKVMKANRKRQSRIKGADLHFTTVMFENGIEVNVLESFPDIFEPAYIPSAEPEKAE